MPDKYTLTHHAQHVLVERKIPIDWVERTINKPQLIAVDKKDHSLENRFCKISEHGNRILKVVINPTVEPMRVISVYFDRTKKGKL
jgi:hypothetical protein